MKGRIKGDHRGNEARTERIYICLLLFLKILFIYLYFLERGKGKEEEREKNISVFASHAPPTRDLAHNPGMCPDWELNW